MRIRHLLLMFSFFFFNDTATTEIYPLSLHDALPILLGFDPRSETGAPPPGIAGGPPNGDAAGAPAPGIAGGPPNGAARGDRKSTRLNSSHVRISYAVFCLKKKKIT